MKLTITFTHSHSPNFEVALELARACPGFTQSGEGKLTMYEVTFKVDYPSHMDLAFKLWHIIQHWRTSFASLDGMFLDGWKLERALAACRFKRAEAALTICFDCHWNGLPQCFDMITRNECPQRGKFKLQREIEEFIKQTSKEPPTESL